MSEAYQISLESSPAKADVDLIRAGLSSYNRTQASDDAFTPLTLVVRDREGKVTGGLLGGTYWGWLVIEVLWVDEAARHAGLGSRLLAQAEEIALQRGCHAAHVDTMSFQAPDFYKERGYTVFGVLDDLPQGHQRIFLKKDLIR